MYMYMYMYMYMVELKCADFRPDGITKAMTFLQGRFVTSGGPRKGRPQKLPASLLWIV